MTGNPNFLKHESLLPGLHLLILRLGLQMETAAGSKIRNRDCTSNDGRARDLMIEVHPNLFVGAEADERKIRGQPGWFVVHACKEPYHRQALGYSGRAAAKDHPEYLLARRDGRLILNLVDVDNVAYIGRDLVDAALEAIHDNIATARVLVHCNQGQSRSPTIALLYLAKYTTRLSEMSIDEALAAFKTIYPLHNPARGMTDYARQNWASYQLI